MTDDQPIHILFVEDVPQDAELAQDVLRKEGLIFTSVRVDTQDDFLSALATFQPDLIISDYAMPAFDGLQALRLSLEDDAARPFIVLTGSLNEETAAACIKAGATNYVLKDHLARLPFAVKEALEQKQARLAKEAAEYALRESERFALSTLDALSAHLAILDNTGEIIAVNRAWREFAAANSPTPDMVREGANYLTVCDTVHGPNSAEAAEMAAGIRAVMRGEQTVFGLEYPCHAPDEQRWFVARVTRFAGDGAVRVVVAHENITERKRAEEALRLRESYLTAILENQPGLVWLKDSDGRFLTVNRAFAESCGKVSPADLAGQTDWDIWPIELAEKYRADDARVIKNKAPTVVEEPIFDRGKTAWFETFKTPIFDNTGGVIGTTGYSRDITERKQAEEALRESEEKFRSFIEQSADGVALLDEQGHIIEWNQAQARITGVPRAQALDLSFADVQFQLLPPERRVGRSPEVFQEALSQAFWTGQSPQFQRPVEIEIQGAAGERKSLLQTAFPIKTDEGYRIGAIVRDITERKRAEAALIESNARFRTLFEASPDAIVLIDPHHDWTILDCNTAACRMNGYTRDELIGQSINLLNLAPVSAAERAEYLEQIRQNNILRLESYHRRKDGTIFSIEVCTSLIALAGRDMVLGIDRDITERKQAEAILRQRVTELELLYENGLALSQLLSPHEIGQKIIDLLAQKLAWHHTTVRLYHPQDETLELLAFDQTGLKGEVERRTVEEHFKTLIARSGQGFSGWVVQHGQPVRSGDVVNDPRYKETAPGLHSGLYVPLKAGERVIGVISVESERPDAFSEADERLTATLAAQAASALENARLFDEIRQRLTEMEAVQTISAALRAAPSRAEMLPVIVHLSFNVLKAAGAVLAMREPTTGETIIVFGHGVWGDQTGLRFPPGIGVGGYVIATGHTYLSNDVQHDQRITPTAIVGDLRGIAAAPLIAQEQIVGVLSVGRYTNYSAEEVQLLTAIADIAANALQRAEVLETLERRVADRTRELAAANERLKELDQLKSKFVSDVSHELRTPITSMSLYIELLEHGKPEKRDLYITRLGQQLARLRAMIEEILDLSRLERDQHEVGLAPLISTRLASTWLPRSTPPLRPPACT